MNYKIGEYIAFEDNGLRIKRSKRRVLLAKIEQAFIDESKQVVNIPKLEKLAKLINVIKNNKEYKLSLIEKKLKELTK